MYVKCIYIIVTKAAYIDIYKISQLLKPPGHQTLNAVVR